MSWKVGYVIATIITVVSAQPTATLQAKSRRPMTSTALTPRHGPDSKQAPKNHQDKIVINAKLVNLTVSVNDKLGRFVAGTLKFIAEPTGGQALFPFDCASAEVVYTRLALMLRRQYVIGFYPSNVTSGTAWHKLTEGCTN